MTQLQTVTITRRTRCLGYGVSTCPTTRVYATGATGLIVAPPSAPDMVGSARDVLEYRRRQQQVRGHEIRSAERLFIGGRPAASTDEALAEIASLVAGDVDSITVQVVA